MCMSELGPPRLGLFRLSSLSARPHGDEIEEISAAIDEAFAVDSIDVNDNEDNSKKYKAGDGDCCKA